MEEKNVTMETDVSVRLDRLVYIILRSWKRLLKISLLGALIGAVLASTMNVIGFSSEERRLKVESEYQIELFAHELQGKNLEIEIQNLHKSVQQQEIYNENSLLMKIDPYNKYVASMIYYVDTDYQIMPEYQYQNIDYGPRLVQMYAEYLTGGEMYSEISEGLSESQDIRFIEELFEISAHHSIGMLEIQVCAESQKMCQEIMEIISQGMNGEYAKANQLIGHHTLTELDKNVFVIVDTFLGETQKQNIQAVTDAMITLEEKQEALEMWEREGIPEAPYSLKSIIKSILGVAVLGFLAGTVLVMAVETVYYVSGDRILGIPEFQDRCTLNVLGELPGEAKKKCQLDHWIDQIGKVTLSSLETKKLVAAVGENIYMAANGGNKTIALIGSIPSEELNHITTVLQNSVGSRMKFIAAGNPLICATTARLVDQSDAVVLVEKQGISTYTDVMKECQRMNLWNMNVLGIVFTNVDSMT